MDKTEEIIKVGIAEMKVVKAPDLIRTTGLGSCVGVVVFDPLMKIAGMAHVMLPDSSLAKSHSVNLAKYADTAVVELVSTVIKQGARKVLGSATCISIDLRLIIYTSLKKFKSAFQLIPLICICILSESEKF